MLQCRRARRTSFFPRPTRMPTAAWIVDHEYKRKDRAMLNVVSTLKGFEIQAKDGSLGTVSDFLFDDSTWEVRWMVVDTGRWLTGRKVLIHPSAVVSAKYEARKLTVALSKAQVKDSPDILQDRPVSQQMQSDLYNYYGWNPLWNRGLPGSGIYSGAMNGGGIGANAANLSAPIYFGASAVREAERDEVILDDGDPHLRSITEVTGYHVHATDGNIGHVESFLVESDRWGIRYLVVDTSNWWVGQHVLISPHAVKDVDWSAHSIGLNIARDKVRSSPPWNPAKIMTEAFDKQLHRHYDWPG